MFHEAGESGVGDAESFLEINLTDCSDRLAIKCLYNFILGRGEAMRSEDWGGSAVRF